MIDSTKLKSIRDRWFWIQDRWFWILVYGLLLVYFAARMAPDLLSGRLPPLPRVLLFAIVLFCVLFVHVFTDPIPLPPDASLQDPAKASKLTENTRKAKMQRRNWMIFAYGFMLLSLLLPIYQFSFGWRGNNGRGFSELIPSDSPISAFVGCSVDGAKGAELSCSPAPKAAEGATPQGKQAGSSEGRTSGASASNGAWVINFGGYVTNPSNSSGNACSGGICQVRGGLLVPLYVIILALTGGTISLTRRLPEYQKRANPEYVATEQEPKLTQHEFREYLVFQIVQFLSAPFLAVLAYYLVQPADVKSSVALAFTAGFASESILVMVRSVADKIQPKTASEPPKTGTISGVVRHAGGVEDKAEVALAEFPQLRAVTDKDGFYVIANVPIGEHGLKGKSADGTRQVTDSVKVERAQEVVTKHLMLA